MTQPARKPAGRELADPEAGIDLVLEAVHSLPTLPEVITQILSLVEDPVVSATRMAQVIGRDQAMASGILRLVNSPFYGLRGRVTSIQHAVVLLGLRAVRNMALSSILVRTFGDASRDLRFNRRLLWRHTVSCAVGARHLSQGRVAVDGEEAFLAGLLHDIGLVIMDQHFHPEFRRVLDLVTNSELGALEAEREVFGLDHAGIGGLLARRWNFPPAVVEAIACHHEPKRAETSPEMAALVHLAHALDEEEVDGRAHQIWEDVPTDLGALELARISPEAFALMRESFGQEWTKAQAYLGLLP